MFNMPLKSNVYEFWGYFAEDCSVLSEYFGRDWDLKCAGVPPVLNVPSLLLLLLGSAHPSFHRHRLVSARSLI